MNKAPEMPVDTAAPSNAAPRPKGPAWRRSRLRRFAFRVVGLMIAFAFICAAGETALRLAAPQKILPRYVTDSGFGVKVHWPNLVTHHSTGEYRIEIRTNSLGMRTDREYPFAKPPGTYRIVGVGDSFTIGYEVEVEDCYLSRVERALLDGSRAAEVLNLGVSGFGTAEELIMLRERGFKFGPDAVVVGYFDNDIGDNTRSQLFALDVDGTLTRRNASYLPAVKAQDFLFSLAPYRFLAENSHLMCFVREQASEIVQKRMRKKSAAAQSLSNDDESKLTAALLDEVKRECDSRGIRLYVLVIPSPDNTSNFPQAFLKDVGAANIVDMRPIQAEPMKTQALYWQKSDGHWNPAGHKLAAEELSRRIVADMTK